MEPNIANFCILLAFVPAFCTVSQGSQDSQNTITYKRFIKYDVTFFKYEELKSKTEVFNVRSKIHCGVVCSKLLSVTIETDLIYSIYEVNIDNKYKCAVYQNKCYWIKQVKSCLLERSNDVIPCKQCKQYFSGEFCHLTMTSCKDVTDRVNGVYDVTSANGDEIKIFCDFQPNEIITFISKYYLSRLFSAGLEPFINNHKKFILRQDWVTEQKDAQLQQLSRYSAVDLKFYVNESGTFAGPMNTVFGDFIFAGFVPTNSISSGSVNGYRVSQTDYSFANCGSSGHSYFAFFPNLGNAATSDTRNYSGYVNMFAWSEITKGVNSNQVLPKEFFYVTEVHFGGCGGFTVSTMLPNIEGTSLGLITNL